jgi:hypothetical protein
MSRMSQRTKSQIHQYRSISKSKSKRNRNQGSPNKSVWNSRKLKQDIKPEWIKFQPSCLPHGWGEAVRYSYNPNYSESKASTLPTPGADTLHPTSGHPPMTCLLYTLPRDIPTTTRCSPSTDDTIPPTPTFDPSNYLSDNYHYYRMRNRSVWIIKH